MKPRALAAFLILFPWAGLFIALLPTWGGGIYYGYGYMVPFLGYLLIFSRIARAPSAGERRIFRCGWWWALIVAGLGICALSGVLEGLDPLWRRALWLHGAGCLLLSAMALYVMGGWKKIFAATGCGIFLLTALPLPFFIEFPLVERLTGTVAEIAAYFLNLAGIPAVASGSILMGSKSMVGVQDTCSGLRSIQAGVMLALLFGEWHDLRFWKRLALVAVALAAAVATNVIRVVWLSWEGLAGTGEISAGTHDVAGAMAFAASVFVILLASMGLAGHKIRKTAENLQLRGNDTLQLLGVGFLASILPFLAAFAWFGNSRGLSDFSPELRLPPEVSARILRIDPETTGASKLLHYDRAQLARYVFSREEWMDLLVMNYDATNSRSWTELLVHGPEICMPALGLLSGTVLEKGQMILDGQSWNLEKFRFKEPRSDKTIYVFRLVWWGGGEVATQQHLQARWAALMQRHRINWTTCLVLGAVVLEQPDEARAYRIFISVVEEGLKNAGNRQK